ncbi:MAG: AraC family transcriptional regulator [Gammaproteobacteria bacterium]|nr:MAG: AraC family transcriptional regulator [Gammaproteobacteria bacterium]
MDRLGVEEYLLSHLTGSVSRADVARYAGVSIRTLSIAFEKHHGIGPMAFLKLKRLQAANVELIKAEPGEISVADVALRYGYTQPSKFSMAYKALFNENPSDTLYRS